MANADFSQKQNSTSGGFDAGSYREQKQPEQAVPLTPLQQKLAGLEAKLPAALSTRAAALALSVVVMLAAFLGFGSAKLRSRYNEVRKWYTVGVAADNGYNLNEELTTRMNTAANIITTASSTLGADSAEVQAAQSLANLKAILAEAGLSMANVIKTVIFLADINDFAAVNAVYAKAFAEPFPARSCVQVAAIPKGAKLEIECIAVRE